MKKLLVLGLCCSVTAVALAANPVALRKGATPNLASKNLVPVKVAPVSQAAPSLSGFAPAATSKYSAAEQAIMDLKANGEPVPSHLYDQVNAQNGIRPGQTQPVDQSRQGGDTIASATVIASLPFSSSGTTTGYVNDYDSTCPYGGSLSADVVYAYTPAGNDVLNLTLCTGATDYDSKLYVYANNSSTLVACNDDACSSPAFANYVSSLSNVAVTAGNTYYIVVDGYGGEDGNYFLDITGGAVNPCDGLGTIACGGSYTGDTTGDTSIGGNGSPDNTFIFTSAVAQSVTFSLCGGSTWDTYLRVYNGCPTSGTLLASNDDFCGLQSQLEFAAGVGTYYVMVEGFSNTSFGPYTLNVSCTTCPAITCTGDAEVEPNDGPNGDPVVFGTIDCGGTVCGTTFASGGTRDTDWYELLLANDGIVTVDLDVESFNGVIYFVDSDASTLLYSADLAGFCADETLTTECLPAGIYYVVAAPNVFDGVGVTNYGLSVTCDPCTYIDPCDVFAAAVTTIPAFPYGDTGTNVGGPDVLGIGGGAVGYLFTLTETSSVTFSACQPGSNYDIDTYLFDANGPCNGGTQLFYNDGNSACTYAAWASEWTQDCTLGAGTYMLVVAGYAGLEGNFEFIIDATGCACPPITCVGTDENEAAGNDGPNEDPVLFGSVACGETICGTTATFGDTLRDLDWFELVLANDAIVTANLDVESFNGILFLIDSDAATILTVVDAAGYCGDEVLVSECLQAGTYYVVAGTNGFTGVDTPANYGLSVTCETCVWVDPYTSCQTPSLDTDPWNAGTSELDVQGTQYLRAERFGGIVGGISAVDFNGLPLFLSGSWASCAEDPMPFTITFYDGSLAPVATYTPTLSGVASTMYAGVYQSYDYHFDLPAPLFLSGGYMSIQGAGANTCWFLWMSSSTGADGASVLSTDGGAWAADTFDLNYCFTTVAAPCDPVTDLTITKSGPNVVLNWTAAAGATAYNVYESADAYTLGALVATVPATTTSFTIAGPKKFYVVKSVCP